MVSFFSVTKAMSVDDKDPWRHATVHFYRKLTPFELVYFEKNIVFEHVKMYAFYM